MKREDNWTIYTEDAVGGLPDDTLIEYIDLWKTGTTFVKCVRDINQQDFITRFRVWRPYET